MVEAVVVARGFVLAVVDVGDGDRSSRKRLRILVRTVTSRQ